MTGQNLSILNGLYQAQAQHLQRNTESQIPRPEFRIKIWLVKGAVGNRWIIRAATHSPKLMHTPIPAAVGVKLESHFTDGAELLFKDWDNVLPSKSMRNEPKLGILCRLRNSIARVRNDEAARAPQDRVGVVYEALVGVKAGAQSVRVGSSLGEHWIQFAGNRGTIDYVSTVIAGGFQLTRA